MDAITAWLFLTRWGNSVLLLPAAICIGIGLWSVGDRTIAGRWAMGFGAAVVIVLTTKLAFLGWGIGIRDIDFTGISGHATLAASVMPMFAWWLTRERPDAARRVAILVGSALAVAVAVSRVVLSTHSVAEVVAGFMLGSLVAALVIPRKRRDAGTSAFRWAALAGVLVLGIVPGPGDSDEAHGLVVRLALQLSGRSEPVTRQRWLDKVSLDGSINRSPDDDLSRDPIRIFAARP